MMRLPRRLLLWGGAAVLATSGFAFMASNSVAASSAGDGGGNVSGYTATNFHYTVSKGPDARVSGVSFDLAANTTAPSARTAPKTVAVYFSNAGVPTSSLLYYGDAPAGGTWPYTGNGYSGGDHLVNACTLSWSPTTGSGGVSCTGLLTGPGFQGPTVMNFDAIHVEANQ